MRRAAPIALTALFALACRQTPAPPGAPVELPSPTGHPRLWLRAADVPLLRSWATQANPLWPPLAALGASARADMDAGKLTSGAGCKDERGIYPCEEAAELFAFLSLVAPQEESRKDYSARAHKILMQVIDTAAHGGERDPLRDPRFPVDDRSRWSGEALPLVVDWIYPTLTKEDKSTIRDVFLQWSDLIQRAKVTTYNHPEPIGVLDGKKLTLDAERLRWAGNNYFTAHARNLALMSLALDRADDPDGKLGAQLLSATGSWLYMIDRLLREDARGGLPPDGMEYGPQSLSYVTQLLWALHTSKLDGLYPQTKLSNNPFWNDLVTGWLHLHSPGTTAHQWLGPMHQPMWWGDAQHEIAPDAIDLFAPIALYDRDTGNTARVDTIRWLQRELVPGKLAERVAHLDQYRQAILYFMLFDPTVPAPGDPRPSLPAAFVAPGIGRLIARSDWSAGAAWLGFGSGWIGVDHQHGDANGFDFYRKGEWLTKERSGYGQTASGSDWHNTLCIENDQPRHVKRDPSDYRAQVWKSGSQWLYGAAGDGKLVAHAESPHYVYALGDATALYNSPEENIGDVSEATRALVWLLPDRIVIVDHAVTKTDGRFKRFQLQLPAPPTLDGAHATMTTARGQRLYIATLAPANALPAIAPYAHGDEAESDPITTRLTVESRARDVRFVHVLQAADGAAAPDWPALLETRGDALAVRSGDTAVVFVNRGGSANLDVSAPAGLRQAVVTGLAPGGGYDVKLTSDGHVHITNGDSLRADGGGVLWWSAR